MSEVNSKDVEELLLKGLATGHVWKVYRNKSLWTWDRNSHKYTVHPGTSYGGPKRTWRLCLRCNEIMESNWTEFNAAYYDEQIPCQPKTTTKP